MLNDYVIISLIEMKIMAESMYLLPLQKTSVGEGGEDERERERERI